MCVCMCGSIYVMMNNVHVYMLLIIYFSGCCQYGSVWRTPSSSLVAWGFSNSHRPSLHTQGR